MARRRTKRASSSSRTYTYRKSYAEAQVERMTWALLVGVFAVIYLLPEGATLQNWMAPLAGAAILLGSGFYQYSRGWRVAPVTWIGGSLMLAAVYYGTQINPGRDLLGITLLVFAAVIAFGLVTGEG
jgi:carbon starvation protein CstA